MLQAQLFRIFVTSIAKSAGMTLGEGIAKNILNSLGLDSGSTELENKLETMSTQLTQIKDALYQVVTELEEIKKNQQIQIEQAKLDSWKNSSSNCEIWFANIYNGWDEAIYESTKPEEWLNKILGNSENDPILSNMTKIHSKMVGLDSPLKAYVDLLKYSIEVNFPTFEPWKPALSFYNYCSYILQHYWYAASMAKTANLMAGDERSAKGCVNSFLDKVGELEEDAMGYMVDILNTLNLCLSKNSTSLRTLYDPFFTVDEFQFIDTYDKSKLEAYFEINFTKQFEGKEGNLFLFMGKEIEMLDDLFSSYRPVLQYGDTGGRINIYLSFWEDFYNTHKTSQKLENIELIKQADQTKIAATTTNTFKAELDIYNKYIDKATVLAEEYYYGDKRIQDVGVATSIYKWAKTSVIFKRWVFFLPEGLYTVDKGDRLEWSYLGADFSFMGSSHYNDPKKQPVEIKAETPTRMIRWSPWNGAYLLANRQE